MADSITPSLFDKSLRRVSGVYLIRNTANNKVYVGSSCDIARRRSHHFCELKAGRHCNAYLQYSFNRHGRKRFTFCVIEECDRRQLAEREQHWIDYYSASDPQKGYNIQPKADHKEMGAISRAKMSAAQKGRRHSEETKSKQSAAWTPERRAAQSAKHRGRKRTGRPAVFTEASRRKISEAHKGKPKSAATRQKMSDAARGRKRSPEVVEMLRNRVFTEETRRKMSEARKKRVGWKHSEETKRKMVAARRRRERKVSEEE